MFPMTRANRLSPWGVLDPRVLDRLFNGWQEESEQAFLVPPMDVFETADEIRCELEVPGMKAEELEISVTGNALTITGEKKAHEREEEGNYRLVERRYGKFARTLALPQNVHAGNVKARFEHGILTVTLPKTEDSKTRRIPIEGVTSPQELEPGTVS